MMTCKADIPVRAAGLQELYEHLAAGQVLVTANNRLFRVLAADYGQWRIDRGDRQWGSPQLLPWENWLNGLWETAGLMGAEGCDRAVPGMQQLISLWESVIRNDPRARRLLRPESLAGQLNDTRRLMTEWRVEADHPAWRGDENENHAAFHAWNRKFEALCHQGRWIPPEDRSALLAGFFQDDILNTAGPIGLLGFDEFNPAQLELLSAINGQGVGLERLELPAEDGPVGLWRARSEAEELQAMARWVRHRAEQNPKSRIAVVALNLQHRRQEIERHLNDILTPGRADSESEAKPWNISMGARLAQVPMIESAFDLLKLLSGPADIQEIGRVLRSPWISGGISEQEARALLEKCLRENYPRRLGLSEILYRAKEIRKFDRDRRELPADQQEPQPWNSPQLGSVLKKLMQFQHEERKARPASAWAEAFAHLLASVGWPLALESESTVSAVEHDRNWQAYQKWQDALRELASLDATTGPLSRERAVGQLRQICREQVFQARTPAAPIQVLGIYEASGLRFDHLWVLGLNSGTWPPPAQVNPFIPGILQQKAGLPHSSPARELEVASTVTGRLLESAAETVFSFPAQAEGESQLPSPLLNEAIDLAEELQTWRKPDWPSLLAESGPPLIEPLQPPRKLAPGMARGGSSILRHQALCPFRAFASNRLAAEGLETPVDGIDGKLHGSLMHRVLERLWKEIGSQSALFELDDAGLDTRIRKHVDTVLDEERGLFFRPSFRGVEGERLVRQAHDFLLLEKEREPFDVIAFENELLCEIEGQTIRLVIDRVDRLASGEEAIIDYKTGKIDPRKWFGARPEDPQLPLYAITAESVPAAVVFSVVREDGCLYRGVVCREGEFPGLPPKRNSDDLVKAGENLPETVAAWRQILRGLMADFLAGDARIDPKNGSKTCDNSYCDLQPLCRVDELRLMAQSGMQEVIE